ncbi:hypothetical protein ACFVVM_24760 [Nocardia sp. NPDC058176]|uniref:hypothetical protein n=1 Tax=Nocardia sp. NPDC058176 TaxID=3346368 RepID=UPI0036D9E776
MRESLNRNTLFNTIAMALQESNSYALVVEGDDDVLLLKRHKSDAVYIFQPKGGRPGVLELAALVEDRRLKRVIFLVDADYDHLLNPVGVYPDNVVLSGSHDIFMDIAYSDSNSLEWVIEVLARHSQRKTGANLSAASLRADAMLLAARVSLFRIINERHGLQLTFRDFPYGKLQTLSPPLESIATILISRSETQMTVEDLVLLVDDEVQQMSARHEISIGDHDFFGSLARVMELSGIKGVSSRAILGGFMSAVSCASISGTGWFSTINGMSRRGGVSIFRCPCDLGTADNPEGG